MGKQGTKRLHRSTVQNLLEKAVQAQPLLFDDSVLKKAQPAIRHTEESIDVASLVKKQASRIAAPWGQHRGVYRPVQQATHKGLQSLFYDPFLTQTNAWGAVQTISPYHGRQLSYRILRRVSEKAWILNLCIGQLIKKVRPFLKPSTDENKRGFRITAKAALKRKTGMTALEQQTAEILTHFILNTGDIDDKNREDDLDKYVSKLIRDICQLDQIGVELQRTHNGKLCAFWAVDPATIEVTLPVSEEATGIKYVQVIDHIPYAFYPRDSFIFDCMNPRTDIQRAGYGYSVVEQAIDLMTSAINTFMFNAGFFTENKLPRGLLLLNGDADMDEVEEIEDYIVNLMSGTPSSQWRIPIIPAGKNSTSSGGRQYEWVSLQGNNREMEFQAWFDLQLSGIVGLFGFSMEDLGLHSQKSAPLIGSDTSPKIESSKAVVLGDILTFLQKHFNTILTAKNPAYTFEFVGYERSDPKLTIDIDKGEIESYKTIDEKRIEKGLPPFNASWSTVPLNSHAVQLLQAEQAGGMADTFFEEDADEQDSSVPATENGPDYDIEESRGTASNNKNSLNGQRQWDALSKSLHQVVKIVI